MKFPAFSIVQNKQLPNNINQIKHSSLKRIVWTPDPFFVNQKEGEVLDNPADNSLFKLSDKGKMSKCDMVFLQIHLNSVHKIPGKSNNFSLHFDAGDITYSSRQIITTYCPMDFHAYPFDTQKCSLEIESFGHTFDEVR